MTGKSHVTINALTVGLITEQLYVFEQYDGTFGHFCGNALNFLLGSTGMPKYTYIFCSAFLFFVGSLFPDIDYPYSVIGKKFIYLPIKHRTWTHAIWLPLISMILGIFYHRLFFWFGLGMFLHDFLDSFSATGIHWFYPIKNKKHVFKLYHTGSMFEYLIVSLVLVVFIAFNVAFADRIWNIVFPF